MDGSTVREDLALDFVSERVHDKIARLILVILQGCHLNLKRLRFMNGKKQASRRFYPG